MLSVVIGGLNLLPEGVGKLALNCIGMPPLLLVKQC